MIQSILIVFFLLRKLQESPIYNKDTQEIERYTKRRLRINELKYARNLHSDLKHLDLKKTKICCMFVCDGIGLLSEAEPNKKKRLKEIFDIELLKSIDNTQLNLNEVQSRW